MSTLHIINTANINTTIQAARAILAGDSVLLVEDGVYLSQQPLPDSFRQASCFALVADVQARGLALPSNIVGIDYVKWVQLVADTNKSVTWSA